MNFSRLKIAAASFFPMEFISLITISQKKNCVHCIFFYKEHYIKISFQQKKILVIAFKYTYLYFEIKNNMSSSKNNYPIRFYLFTSISRKKRCHQT